MTLGTSQKACAGDSFDMNLSLCAVKRGPPKDEDLLFLRFWTNFRKNGKFYKYFVNFSSFAIQLGSGCIYLINDCRGVFRTQSNSYDEGFCKNSQRLKAVRHLVRAENAFHIEKIDEYKVKT